MAAHARGTPVLPMQKAADAELALLALVAALEAHAALALAGGVALVTLALAAAAIGHAHAGRGTDGRLRRTAVVRIGPVGAGRVCESLC